MRANLTGLICGLLIVGSAGSAWGQDGEKPAGDSEASNDAATQAASADAGGDAAQEDDADEIAQAAPSRDRRAEGEVPTSAASRDAEVSVASEAVCRLGNHGGIPEADAQTASSIVCGELAMREPPAGRVYSVGLGKLGEIVVLSLSESTPTGSATEYRQTNLSSIEEVPVAAPRLVEALLDDKPLAETATVDNLVGDETRKAKKRRGSMNFMVGALGLFADGGDRLESSVGLDLALGYQTPRTAIGFDARFGAITNDNGVGLFATGPYARYYFSGNDIAPFVGGGMGPTMITVSTDDTWGSRWGIGLWGEAGVQLMRTHKTQFVVLGRLNVPTFKVEGYDYYEEWDEDTESDPDAVRSSYAMPFELVAAINFD